METVTLPQLPGVCISVKFFFLDVLNLPSLTVFSPWLFEWSGRSETRVWWECECLALRLSISVAVSELPRLVNFPRMKTRNWYQVYSSERFLEVLRDSSWRQKLKGWNQKPWPSATLWSAAKQIKIGYLVGVHWCKGWLNNMRTLSTIFRKRCENENTWH